MERRSTARRLLSFVAAMALVAGTSRAATYTWIGGAVPTWDTTGTNWGGSALDSYKTDPGNQFTFTLEPVATTQEPTGRK